MIDENKKRPLNAHGTTIGQLRKRAFRSATPAVAQDVGISPPELARFLAGAPHAIDRAKLHVLAQRLGLTQEVG